MRFLRSLRIFIPLLIIAAIVAGVVVVVTSRSELQSARRDVDTEWGPLRKALDTRYAALTAANDAVRDVPGPLHQIVVQVDTANAAWRNAKSGSVGAQVAAANSLEALGRRLVLAARAAPRLEGKPALDQVNTYAASGPPGSAARSFKAAVEHYERERNRPARRLAATLLGYKSLPSYDASGSA